MGHTAALRPVIAVIWSRISRLRDHCCHCLIPFWHILVPKVPIECHRTNMNQHCYKHKNLEFPDPQHEHWVFGKVWHGRPFTVQRTKLWHFCEACPVIIGSYWIHRAPDGPRWTTIHWQWASNWRSLKLRVSTCGLLPSVGTSSSFQEIDGIVRRIIQEARYGARSSKI